MPITRLRSRGGAGRRNGSSASSLPVEQEPAEGGLEFTGDPVAPDEAVAAEQLAAVVGTEDGGDPKQGRRLVFCVVSIALLMASIDSTIVASALDQIRDGLHSHLNWIVWTITIYQLGQIIVMPLAGKLSDMFGRRTIFLVAIVIFTLSSLACGLSTSDSMLIPLRFVQSIGGGAFLPSASGIVADHFGRDRDRALGMFTSIFPVGGIIGPAIGGPIAVYLGWRYIFFINVPIGAVLLALAFRFLPQSVRRPSSPVDFKGVSLLASTIVCGMTAITFLGEPHTGISSWHFLLPAAVTIGLGWGFVHHIRRDAAPFIPPRLLAGKGFATMNVINFFVGTSVLGFGSLIPLYAEDRYGISASDAGTVLSARAFGMILVAAAAAMTLRRTGYRLPMRIGFSIITVGVIMTGIGPHGLSPYWWLAISALVSGLGFGIAVPATNNASLQLAPNDVGAISGLRGMFRQTGGIVYVSIVSAMIARSVNTHAAGLLQAHVFWAQSLITLVLIFAVSLVPDHHGSW